MFTNPKDPGNILIKQLLAAWSLAKLALPAHTPVQIEELGCADGSCPVRETIIRIRMPEGERVFTISKPLTFVRKYDLAHWREGEASRHQHR